MHRPEQGEQLGFHGEASGPFVRLDLSDFAGAIGALLVDVDGPVFEVHVCPRQPRQLALPDVEVDRDGNPTAPPWLYGIARDEL